MAAEIRSGVVVGHENLFPDVGYHKRRPFAQYDISPSGDRFVMLRSVEADGPAQADLLMIATNWFEELKRLVPN